MTAPDMECTWFVEWLFFLVTPACQLHDLGLSDEGFFLAIVGLGSAAGYRYINYIVAAIYYVGVKLGGPIYRLYKKKSK